MVLAPLVVGPQGRAGRPLRGAALAGVRAAAHQRRGARDRRAAEARAQPQAHDRDRGRPPEGPGGHQAAARRILRDGAAACRRAGAGRRDGLREGAPLLREVRLPAVQLLDPGARAAPLLVQQSHGRVPAVRRAGPGHVLRPEARRRLPAPVARGRGHPRLGPAQPVLLLDARVARAALRVRRGDAVREPARAGAGRGPGRLGRGEDRLPLPRGARKVGRARARLRGDPAEPRAPVPRDRLRRREGGAREVPQQPRLPRLRRRAAAAGGPARPRRGALDPGGLGDAPEGRAAVLRAARARRQPPGDRREDPARDRQPHPLPERRGARLPLAHALGGHALGRRGAAHPAREPDRLRAHGRHVRARRALHRAAPARQREAHRHAQAPARPRQFRDRGRARRGGDPRGRPRRRHGAGGRRARRRGRRAGHPHGDRAQSRLAHRPVPFGAARDRGAGEPAPPRRQAQPSRRGRPRQQPQGRDGRRPRRALRVRDGRVGLRQVDPDQRHPLRVRRAPPLRRRDGARRARRDRGAGSLRQGDQRRPEPHRAHAALQSRHLHGALHARSATSSPARRNRGRAATGRAASRST